MFSSLISRPVNGTSRLFIFGISYDVGLIELVLYIISLCGILPKMREVSHKYIKIISMYVLCSFFIFKSGNLTYLVIFYFTNIFLLISIRFSKKFISILLSVPLLSLCYYFMILEPYRFARFTSFLHFKEFRTTSGYINYKIYELLLSSKILGNGVSKEIFVNLPSLNQDFIYCYIIYTFGWVIGAVIFGLIIILLVNLLPIKMVVPIPFLSNSGSSIVINSALVGVICSIYGRKNLSKSLIKVK